MNEVNKYHICIEGIDGSGKTTTATIMKEFFNLLYQKERYPYIFDKDTAPYTKTYRNVIKEIIGKKADIHKYNEDVFTNKKTKILYSLFMADNEIHHYDINKNYNEYTENKYLISDRDIISTIVYQGPEIGVDTILVDIHNSENIKYPGLILYLNIEKDIAYNRIIKRDENNIDIYETPKYLEKNINLYKEALEKITDLNKDIVIKYIPIKENDDIYTVCQKCMLEVKHYIDSIDNTKRIPDQVIDIFK